MEITTTRQALLVSKKETAAMLGISLRTLDSLIASKQLACRRIGRRTLIPFAALQQFVKHDHLSVGVSA